MINKRQLDELIRDVICDPERDCAYTFEEYCQTPFCQKHVCQYVRDCCMPYYLTKYLYENCYYDDIETVQANVDYINQTMPTVRFYETWQDIVLDTVLERIAELKKEAEKESEEIPSFEADLGELMDKALSAKENNSIEENN